MHATFPSRARPIALTTLVFLSGLHVVRVFLPLVVWYLGEYLGQIQLGIFALAVFALLTLAPIIRRGLNGPACLILSAGGLALVRLALQFNRQPAVGLALAGLGCVLFGWFIIFWQQSRHNRPDPDQLPFSALGVPLALLLDTASRSLSWSYDLIWQNSILAIALGILLALATLLLLWRELISGQNNETRPIEPSNGRALLLLGLGSWFFLNLQVFANPQNVQAATGWGDVPAHLFVNGAITLSVLFSVWAASRIPSRDAVWQGLTAVVLTACMAFLYLSIGPAWIWDGLGAVCSGAVLGWMLAASARSGALRPGIWRTTLGVFLGFFFMLVCMFLALLEATWISLLAGAMLGLVGLWAVTVVPGTARRPYGSLAVEYWGVGLTCVLALIAVGIWAWQNPPLPTHPDSTSQTLRVLTYNIHQGINANLYLDLDAIISVVQSQHPDIVSLNEVARARANNGYTDTLALLSRRLGMPYTFGANSSDGQYGNAILSRYPIASWGNLQYTKNTTEVRGLLQTVVNTPTGSITVYSTHLDHIGKPTNARAAQISEALQKWSQQPKSILMGDFNAPPNAPELSGLFQSGLVDQLAAGGLGDTFTFWNEAPRQRIDYLMTSPDFQLERIWTVPDRASDHLPVVADFKW